MELISLVIEQSLLKFIFLDPSILIQILILTSIYKATKIKSFLS